MAAMRAGEVPDGTKILASRPSQRAMWATARPWLPSVAAARARGAWGASLVARSPMSAQGSRLSPRWQERARYTAQEAPSSLKEGSPRRADSFFTHSRRRPRRRASPGASTRRGGGGGTRGARARGAPAGRRCGRRRGWGTGHGSPDKQWARDQHFVNAGRGAASAGGSSSLGRGPVVLPRPGPGPREDPSVLFALRRDYHRGTR